MAKRRPAGWYRCVNRVLTANAFDSPMRRMGRRFAGIGKMMRYGLATLAAIMAVATAGAEAAQPNLRIGLALPHEGPYLALAESVERGWHTAIAEANGKVGGRKIEIVSIDTKGDPETAKAVVLELLRAERIDIMAGVINSGVAVTLGRLAVRFKRPLVVAVAIANAITGPLCNPYVARTSFGAHAFYYAAGRHLARTRDTTITMGPEHPAVGPILDAFRSGFEAGGGSVVREIRTPLGSATPWNQVIAGIQSSKAAMIFAFYAGPSAVELVRAHAAAGLKDLQPLVGGPWLYGEENWAAMGSTASGASQVTSHLRSLGNPANRRFVAAYRARYKSDPDLYAYFGYENAQPILAAVAALKGDTADGAKVIATLTKRSYEMPRGELRFNADNNAAIDNLYLARLERTSGKTRRRYVETVPGAGDPPGCRMRR